MCDARRRRPSRPAVRRPAYGTDVPLTSYRHHVKAIERHLSAVGLRTHARTIREPEFAHESTPQAFILARSTDVE